MAWSVQYWAVTVVASPYSSDMYVARTRGVFSDEDDDGEESLSVLSLSLT